MTIKTDLGIIEYYYIVEEIAHEYFDENGEYQPHIGILNTMRLFYNKCVTESEFDVEIPHDNTDAMKMEPLLADKGFIKAFNDAISGNGMVCLNFANACQNAMDIVNDKKSSISRVTDIIKKSIEAITDMISPALSEENITAVSKIAQGFADGNISADAIVEAYANKLRNDANAELKLVDTTK